MYTGADHAVSERKCESTIPAVSMGQDEKVLRRTKDPRMVELIGFASCRCSLSHLSHRNFDEAAMLDLNVTIRLWARSSNNSKNGQLSFRVGGMNHKTALRIFVPLKFARQITTGLKKLELILV